MLPLDSFFDEMEKIAVLPSLTAALAGQAIKYPGMVGWRLHQIDQGIARHRAMTNAVEQGYPAGWVALGMRPR